MKKFIFLIIVSFICSINPGVAQKKLSFGMRFNPQFSTLFNKSDKHAGSEIKKASSFNYLSFGFGAMYNLNKHMGVGLDFLFSREGQKYTGNMHGDMSNTNPDAYSSIVALQSYLANETITNEYEAVAEPNFIKIPLMFSYSTNNTKLIYFNGLIGPQFNINESVAQEVDGEDHDYPGTNIKPKDIYKSLTMDGMLAVGVGFNLAKHFLLTTHLRFDYGFGDLEKKNLIISDGTNQQKLFSSNRAATHNATAGLSIGINYKL